jgi:hypothetical protein
MTFSKPDLYRLDKDIVDYRQLPKTIIRMLLFLGYVAPVGECNYQTTYEKPPATGLNAFQFGIEISPTSSVQLATITLTYLKPRIILQKDLLDGKRASVKEEKYIEEYAKNIDFRPCFKDQRCFFIYSCRAFSNSSLTFRADPVFETTNCIHSFQTCLSILIEVLAFFSLSWLNSHDLPFMVDKDNGKYHKLNIEIDGNMVLRYNGNTSEFQLQTMAQVFRQEDTTIR